MMPPPLPVRRETLTFMAVASAALVFQHLISAQFFPIQGGALGIDYTYFFPRLLDGYYWYHTNGLFAVPWFTPSFCGGLPFMGNPQSMYYSVPQFLSILFGPLKGIYLTFMVFSFAGFAGFYLLMKDALKISRPLAYLGAVLFMFNGFYTYRMLVGHLAFHCYQLLPLALYFLLRPLPPSGDGRAKRALLDSTAAAVVFAMMVYSGMLELGLPVGACVVMVGAIGGLRNGRDKEFWGRFALSCLIALALSAARLYAALAFMIQFQRDFYAYPGGVKSPLSVLWLLAQTIYFWPENMLIYGARFSIGARWFVHPFAFYEASVTAVPLILGVFAAIMLARRALSADWRRFATPMILINLALVAAVPLLVFFLFYSAEDQQWAQLLKSLPIIKTYVNFTCWLSVLIPAAIIIPLLMFDSIKLEGMRLHATVAGCMALAALQIGLHERDYYLDQHYKSQKVEDAFNRAGDGRLTAGVERIVDQSASDWTHTIVKYVPMGGDDYLAQNASQMKCYEPIFGYSGFKFPLGRLKPGPALAEEDGFLNIKNPACYPYPKENNCAPGDHFRTEDRLAAENFVNYRPFRFQAPIGQKLANWATAVTLLFCLLLMLHHTITAIGLRFSNTTRGR